MAASPDLPKTMRVLRQPSADKTSYDDLYMLPAEPLPVPNLSAGEHLIKVAAVSICNGELTWAQYIPSMIHPSRVPVPCYDVAGTVVAAPANSAFPPNTKVFVHSSASYTGCAREYAIVGPEGIAVAPRNLSFEQAATVPLSAITAWQALFVHGGLSRKEKSSTNKDANQSGGAGKRVLVTAASGGVGVWAVQLARHIAADVGSVIAVVGSSNVDLARDLGATEVIDYKKQSLGDWVANGNEKVDLVLDMAGGQTLTDAWTAVKEGATLISVCEDPEPLKPLEGDRAERVARDIRSLFFIWEADGKQLGEIAGLIEEGTLRPHVDSVWNFEDFKSAFAKVESRRAKGKVVIKIS